MADTTRKTFRDTNNFFYFLAFWEANRDTLVSLRPEMWQRVFLVVQSTELDIVNGSFCNLCALALVGWRYISSLHSADELQ